MGGKRYRAGRPGWRRKCEDLIALDIRHLAANNRLSAGSGFSWHWSLAGEPHGAVHIKPDAMGLNLRYAVEYRAVNQRVQFAHTACRFGGLRTWFACPQCGRACVILYGLDHHNLFSCRLCMDLAYSSESDRGKARLWRKQLKLEARLDSDGGKPKWVRWRTFNGICAKIDAIENQRMARVLNASG